MRVSGLNRGVCACLSVASILLCCAQASADSTHKAHAASVLFERYETVFYAESGLLAKLGRYRHLPQRDSESLRRPFWYVLGALQSLSARSRTRTLADTEAVLVGAKDFLPPRGLGSVRSQVCYILILRAGSSFDLSRYVRQPPRTHAGSLPIWSWSAQLNEFGENDPSASLLHATQVQRNYVLISNDADELQAVAEQLSSAGPGRDISGIKQWEEIDKREVWGYRRFRHSGVVDRIAAGMDGVTAGAEALAFFVDLPTRTAVVRLFGSADAQQTATHMSACGSECLPPMRSIGEGAWESVIPIRGDEESFERMFYVMGSFGFGLYV